MTQEPIIPITDSEALAALCQRLGNETYVTVDTEFMRERTYYPQLCLVQIAGENEAAIIDAQADLDWTPFWTLMQNENILKVFHAPRQDIEIFVKLSGHIPTPVYDTQIAALAAGFPDQVSYARLAEALIGTVIDKQEQFTDWTARPLRPAQLVYALQDVTILRRVYAGLQAKLIETGRHEWLDEEMATLRNMDFYRVNPDDAWEKIKLRSNRPSSWATLRLVAAWREREAIRLNRPRQMIMKDDVLSQLALSVPLTVEALAKTRGLPNQLGNGQHAEKLVALFNEAKLAKGDIIPKRNEPPMLNPVQEDKLELLKMALKIIARQQDLSPKLIANNDKLAALVLGEDVQSLMQGWRHELFGKMAKGLLNGEIALKIKENRLVLEQA